MSLLATIGASVGSSLVSGILGRSKSQTSQSVNLKKMVKDAQAAGFNPLTVLQATGGSGWGSQASASDLDFGSMAAAAAVQGVSDYWSQQQQRDLMDAQIDLTQAETQSIRGQLGQRQAALQGAPVQEVPTAAPITRRAGTAPTIAADPASPDLVARTAGIAPLGVGSAGIQPNYTAYDTMGDPLEAEAELWGSAKTGQLGELGMGIVKENTDPRTHGFIDAYAGALSPSTYLDAWEHISDFGDRMDGRRDAFIKRNMSKEAEMKEYRDLRRGKIPTSDKGYY